MWQGDNVGVAVGTVAVTATTAPLSPGGDSGQCQSDGGDSGVVNSCDIVVTVLQNGGDEWST